MTEGVYFRLMLCLASLNCGVIISENSLPQETPSKHRLMRSFTMVISKCLLKKKSSPDMSVKTGIKYTKKIKRKCFIKK